MPGPKANLRTADDPIDAPHRRRLPPLLRQAWYGLNQAFRRRIAHLGLTPDQFTALRWLLEAGDKGLTQKQLTECMASDANTITSLVTRMEAQGFVTRRTDPADRRARRVRIRPAGRNRYAAARRIAIALQAEVLEVLPSAERERFLKQLEQIARACGQSGR